MGIPVPEIKPGHRADLILFNPDGHTTFTAEEMKSKSQNTPFLNRTLDGSVDLVLLGSQLLKDRA
jgi:dihydroorotase